MGNRSISVNGVALDDPTKGWRILKETSVSATVTPRLAGVEVYGRNGVIPVGPQNLQPADIGIVVAVSAPTPGQRWVAQGLLAAALATAGRKYDGSHTLTSQGFPLEGLGRIRVEEDDQVRECDYRLKSLTWVDKTPVVCVAQAVLELPIPLWEGKLHQGVLTGPYSGDARGSAPVEILFSSDSDFSVQCLNSNGVLAVNAARITGPITRESPAVTKWTLFYPDSEGRYRFTLIRGSNVQYQFKERWL